MKKSKFIDYAVLMAVRSGKNKKKKGSIDDLLNRTLEQRKPSGRANMDKVVASVVMAEIFSEGLMS